jgi:farnesyl diphosphate synthase
MRRLATEIDQLYEKTLAIPSDRRYRLYKAMRYAAVGGGKRLRPLLVVAAGDLFGVPREQTLCAGLAVECVHVQSLVHDDLPCMDDDDLRRGRPALHRAFDEATAVLAGDALLVLAFEILAAPRTYPDAEVRTELILKLAKAAGAPGMAGGQMLDILAQSDLDAAAVTQLQELKMGALFGWYVEAGAIMGRARNSCEPGYAAMPIASVSHSRSPTICWNRKTETRCSVNGSASTACSRKRHCTRCSAGIARAAWPRVSSSK